MEEELIPFGTPQEQLATVNQAIYNILVGGTVLPDWFKTADKSRSGPLTGYAE